MRSTIPLHRNLSNGFFPWSVSGDSTITWLGRAVSLQSDFNFTRCWSRRVVVWKSMRQHQLNSWSQLPSAPRTACSCQVCTEMGRSRLLSNINIVVVLTGEMIYYRLVESFSSRVLDPMSPAHQELHGLSSAMGNDYDITLFTLSSVTPGVHKRIFDPHFDLISYEPAHEFRLDYSRSSHSPESADKIVITKMLIIGVMHLL
jgi:hypothetical protein